MTLTDLQTLLDKHGPGRVRVYTKQAVEGVLVGVRQQDNGPYRRSSQWARIKTDNGVEVEVYTKVVTRASMLAECS